MFFFLYIIFNKQKNYNYHKSVKPVENNFYKPAVVVPIRVGALRSGLFFMFLRDSRRGFEMIEDGAVGAAGVVELEGAEVRTRDAGLATLGAVMVRSIVGAGVVEVAGVVSVTGVEREIREGVALMAGADPNEEVGAGWENRAKEGAGDGVGSEAGGGISGSGRNKRCNKELAASISLLYSQSRRDWREHTRVLQDLLYLAQSCFLLHI